MTDQAFLHTGLGLVEDLGPGPASYSKPHQAVKADDGQIRRVPLDELDPVWVVTEELDGQAFRAVAGTEEEALELVVAEMEAWLEGDRG